MATTEAAQEVEQQDLPRSRKSKPDISEGGFFAQINSLSPSECENKTFYIYQLQPVVDLTKGGTEPKYRTVMSRPFTEEDLKNECGSGKYEIRMNEKDTNGRHKTTGYHVVEIFDQ